MKIYTDIDYVLHDYSPRFLEAALQYFKITKPPKPIKFPKKSYYPSLAPYIEAFDMSDELVWDLVMKANEIEGLCPTPCFSHIKDFIMKKKRQGAEVIAVTARSTRTNAEKMVQKHLGKNTPVITVDTPYKHLVVEDGSIYFEDHPEAVEGVLQHRKDVLIIVPKWPWNLDIPKDKSIIHLDPHGFSKLPELIEERLAEYV